MDENIAIRVSHVSKNFVLPHEKSTSLKSVFTGLFNNRGESTKQVALKNINFDIKKGEFFGIVGRNGSGKSTLLKIIAGIYQPTKGSVSVSGKLVPFIELGVGFNPELTGRENVYLNGAILGFSNKKIEGNYNKIVEFAELEKFMDQKLKNYSSGMQVRLAFACATMAEAEVLLVDEVLAVGDADFQRKCFNYFRSIKKEKKTVVFVTHDMNAVREYCDKAVLIDDSAIRVAGRPEKVAQQYSKLFLEAKDATKPEQKNTKRWGNSRALYRNTRVVLDKKSIKVHSNITIKADIDKLIYGLHIFSLDGRELTAMNNRMISRPDINDIKTGQSIDIDWELLNIFNDGTYSVTLTLVDSNGSVFDWYNDIARFTVRREERSTTAILPPITVSAEVIK